MIIQPSMKALKFFILLVLFADLAGLTGCDPGRSGKALPSVAEDEAHYVKPKTSLNAYSFNEPLAGGKMDLYDLLEYCSGAGFDAVDITAYYFPGYPEVPPDEYLYRIRQKAFLLGLDISGTGVRNDFSNPDPGRRAESVGLVKNWILAAEKLGAPVIRIFAGNSNTDGYTREEVLEWMLNDIRSCVEFGKQHGVVVAIQNHNDFIQTAEQAIEIIEKINSDWFGLILDTGSFRTADAYDEISRCIPYAVNWQIKTKIYDYGEETDIDLDRLFRIIRSSGYRGYVPIETLDPGDPVPQVNAFFRAVNESMNRVYSEKAL